MQFSAQAESLNPIGRVVDLMFIDDDRLAELVSWWVPQKHALVFDTKEQRQEARN